MLDRESRRKYQKKSKTINPIASRGMQNLIPRYIRTVPVNEETLEIIEVNCSYFGCGKELSLVEKLSGELCLKHMNIQKPVFNNGLI